MELAAILLSLLLISAFEIPLHLPTNALSSRVGETALKNYINMQYHGTLYFGTPSQSFTTVFSTGEAWTWLNDVSCGKRCHSALKAFNRSESSSYVESEYQVTMDYGTEGLAVADLGYETVRLRPDAGEVHKQAILLMLRSVGRIGQAADGITGLAFSSKSFGRETFLENLKLQGVIKKSVFAFYLSDYNYPEMPSSSLSFGDYDLEKYALQDFFSYVRVEWDTGLWTVPLQRLSYGLKALDEYQNAVISSGSSLISLTSQTYDSVHSITCSLVTCIPSSEGEIVFLCPAGEEILLPDLTFKLGEHEFPLTYKHYVGKEGKNCYLQVDSNAVDMYVLGYPFMRAYYTLFDAENYRIGFARSLNNPFPSNNWYIWLGIGVIGVVIVVLAVWCFKCRKDQTEETKTLMEPLIRSNDS